MKVLVHCMDKKLEIPVGTGKQHIRWLALVVATRMQKERYPHSFQVPHRVLNSEGVVLRARQAIRDVVADGDELTVELRQGATIPEEDVDSAEWFEEAYGPHSNLMECKFKWKVDKSVDQDLPKFVRGEYTVAPRWQPVFPPKEYGGHFEIPIEAVELGDGQFDWVATRKGPPGTCKYVFVMENKDEAVNKASQETLLEDGSAHFASFLWDVPIAPEPYPELDSRPSTASSRDGAQVDPRLEQDWDAMRLKWVEAHMKVRIKDVLTEFYSLLIDLFDSYAFMGLDLSASQHTIGMDDWKHLLLNCGLLKGQPEGNLPWSTVCTWFEEAIGVRDGRPYLAQRLTRAHYLELLIRTASYVMCEHPTSPPDTGPMPQDEGLFRFITELLVQVMDRYDDSPIRKDAVKPENLVVIQHNRPSIRSAYAFLAQPCPSCDNEKAVQPATLKHIFEFVMEKLQGAEDGAPAEGAADGEGGAAAQDFFAVFSGEDRLKLMHVITVWETLDKTVEEVTRYHPEPLAKRGLMFWEFFEVLMESCRELESRHQLALDQGISCMVDTLLAFMGVVDAGAAELPGHCREDQEEEEEEEEAEG